VSTSAATGFVMAGGRSLRMGRDKALLPWAGATLIDHAVARLREACPDVRILSGPQARYADRGVPAEPDVMVDAGPLGGLYTGLLHLHAGDAVALFLAVDLPLVPVELLRRLAVLAAGHDAAVPVAGDGPHPLCAAYRRSCLEAVQRCLQRGERRMTAFWPDVRVRRVSEAELAPFGDPGRMLRNVNTLEDYLDLIDATRQ